MPTQFEKQTIHRFLTSLGSQTPAPGGGAAAALVASAGAALAEMTSRLNDVRLKKSSGNASRAAASRVKFLRLMNEDARVFAAIQKQYPLRRSQKASWQRVLKNGASVPLEICELCGLTAEFAQSEKNRTSRWLESDRKEALILLAAAFKAAELNVEINLSEITDNAFNQRTRKKLSLCRRKLQKS